MNKENKNKSMAYLTKDNTKESLNRNKSTISNRCKNNKILINNNYKLTEYRVKNEKLKNNIIRLDLNSEEKINLSLINDTLKKDINDLKNKNKTLEDNNKQNLNKIAELTLLKEKYEKEIKDLKLKEKENDMKNSENFNLKIKEFEIKENTLFFLK